LGGGGTGTKKRLNTTGLDDSSFLTEVDEGGPFLIYFSQLKK
jgi:hypothetical protein